MKVLIRCLSSWEPDVTFTKQKLSFPRKERLNIEQEGYTFVYLSYGNDSPNVARAFESGTAIGTGQLSYLPEEHSIYMEPTVYKVDMELILNKLSLAVTDNIVVHVSGFCGLNSSMKSDYEIPDYTKGVLKVEHDLKHGFAYGINER